MTLLLKSREKCQAYESLFDVSRLIGLHAYDVPTVLTLRGCIQYCSINLQLVQSVTQAMFG